MQRVHRSKIKIRAFDRAAGVHRLDLFGTPLGQMHGQLEHCKQRGSACLANLWRIAHVIVVAVRERDVRHTLSCCIPLRFRGLKCRVALEKWVNQDNAGSRLYAKARMAKPRNLHFSESPAPLGIAKAARSISKAGLATIG